MQIYNLNELDKEKIDSLLVRNAGNSVDVTDTIARVQLEGDTALRALTQQYDNVSVDNFRLSNEAIQAAVERVPETVKVAFQAAAQNITAFHELQRQERRSIETMPGVRCYLEQRAITNVGLYIPGGSAPLPSTVLMLGIPAKIAGCRNISIVTPPADNDRINDAIVYAAQLCGIDTIYTVGGAQAIAALAYGTESIPKVDKIFGPGNAYVTAAKMNVSVDPAGAAIDIPAGPTEVLVITDASARADFVASDLLAQAEHDASSQSILVCTDRKKTEEILLEVEKQKKDLSRSAQIEGALKNSYAVVVDSTTDAIDFSNRYAPEHLIINTADSSTLSEKVMNAGSVFIGAYSCESAGDYASGPNHCLPTLGYAGVIGGVSLSSFQKQITFQSVSKEGAALLAPIVTTMASQEGLDGHRKAMEIRLT